ncbi:TRAP transporter small permease [Jiella avicenniae]|uniref:TRAP transporter small permease protein n=1 Tax=Jiella avicenniae TaxID=2907202 RepID=A0A9X1T6L5_9HYPH|nr:TRAP transporter small permease [Jiella avicenniae]MCE7029470.1 TRAP transporter small permease [Jiella avicenniae]
MKTTDRTPSFLTGFPGWLGPSLDAPATRIGNLVEILAGLVCVVLFALMIVVVSYEVAMRYLFNAPTYWSGELARWSMVWLALLGMAIAVRRLDHIRVDILVDVVSHPVKVAMAVMRYAVTFGFAAVMLIFGARLTILNATQTSPGLGWPLSVLYLAPTVSAVLMILFLAELVWRREIRPF